MKTFHAFSNVQSLKGLFLFLLLINFFTSLGQDLTESNNPQVSWTRKAGSAGYDRAEGIACEFMGDVYVAGCFNSANVSGGGLFTNTFNGGNYDGYLMKTDKENNILWSVFVGGSSNDFCTSVALTSDGNVVVTGYTSSDDMGAGVNAVSYNGGTRDVFCNMYDNSGNLLWSTYVGGNGDDYSLDMEIGPDDEIYIVGKTNSTVTGYDSSLQSAYGGGSADGFYVSLDTEGIIEAFSYFGGPGTDEIKDITCSDSGKLYLCGYTSGIPLLNTITNLPYGGGTADAFIMCINQDQSVNWAQYVGGSMTESFNTIAMDHTGNIIVSGNTNSGPMAFLGQSDELTVNNQDVMLVSFTESGSMLWSRFITGSSIENSKDIHVDLFGNIYLGGTSGSNNLSVINAFQETNGGSIDNFLSKWSPDGELKWLTYLGGSDIEWMGHLSSDRFGKVMVAGFTFSPNYGDDDPNLFFGDSDVTISRISDCANPDMIIHTNDDTTFCDGGVALLTACGASHFEWMNTDTLNLTSVDSTIQSYVIGHNVEGCYGMSNIVNIVVLELPEVVMEADGPTVFCGEGMVTLTASGALSYEWSDELQSTTESITVSVADLYAVTGMGENGCSNSAMTELVINELPEAIMTASSDTVCISGAPVFLIGLPLGGQFSGPGIVNSTFDPFLAGGGIHEITYLITDENGCSGESEPVSIEVFYFPTVLFVANDTLCTFSDAMQLVGTPLGGVFSGDGVIGDIFYPNLPGTGPQNITYSYLDDRGCTNFDNSIIYVDACLVEAVENESTTTFSVYPNPASDFVTINNPDNVNLKVSVLESSGKLIQTYNGQSNLRIDTNNLPAGFYYLNIQNEKSTSTIPLVVAR